MSLSQRHPVAGSHLDRGDVRRRPRPLDLARDDAGLDEDVEHGAVLGVLLATAKPRGVAHLGGEHLHHGRRQPTRMVRSEGLAGCRLHGAISLMGRSPASTSSRSSSVESSVSQASPAPTTASASARLSSMIVGDALLDRALADELVDEDGAALADAVGAVGRLVLDGGVPPAVVVDDVAGAR